MVLDWSLQDDVQKQMQRVENADRLKPSGNDVQTEIIQDLYGRGSARQFTFDYDEPEHVAGGTDRGPRPLEYFLAGMAFCQQVQYARNALATGIGFDDLGMEVHGDVMPGETGFVDDTIRYTTHIESDADPDDVAELVELAEEGCHAHYSLTEPTTIEREVRLNGELLDV